jgi:hypothetical protein
LPHADDNGDDEHSDRWQEEDPSDLRASDTGAHFTHPLSQKRGFVLPLPPSILAAELDIFVKMSALGKAVIPPTAFIKHLLTKKTSKNFKFQIPRLFHRSQIRNSSTRRKNTKNV